MNLPCAAAPRKLSGRSRKPAWRVSARYVPRSYTGGALGQRPDFSKPAFWRGLPRFRLRQEFITPYTPEQNGLIERFFRSLKEECVWQHNFSNFAEARAAITQWIEWCNAAPPLQALGYRSPRQFRALQPQLVA